MEPKKNRKRIDLEFGRNRLRMPRELSDSPYRDLVALLIDQAEEMLGRENHRATREGDDAE